MTNLMVASATLSCVWQISERGSVPHNEVYLDAIQNAARRRPSIASWPKETSMQFMMVLERIIPRAGGIEQTATTASSLLVCPTADAVRTASVSRSSTSGQ